MSGIDSLNAPHILLASDLSTASRAAHVHAAGLAQTLKGRVTLLHIDQSVRHGAEEVETATYIEAVDLVPGDVLTLEAGDKVRARAADRALLCKAFSPSEERDRSALLRSV